MALTISEKFRMTAGGRKFMFLDVTHDESTISLTALEADLTCIEWAMIGWRGYASDAANTSVLGAMLTVSIVLEGQQVNFGAPGATGSKSALILLGW